jgi:pimeloyl-ACP methyl ester carboxylesterase
MRALLKVAVVACAAAASSPGAAEQLRWETFPRPAAGWIERAGSKGCLDAGSARMFYAVFGAGDPVLLIHGGLGNADVWEDQVKALSARHMVIVADSRRHGRSTGVQGGIHYRTMTDDYIALLDHLKLAKVAVVGWSDGAIIGLDMAMRYRARVSRVFAHAANSRPGVGPAASGARTAWNAYAAWARQAYDGSASTRCTGAKAPKASYQNLSAALRVMWRTEPRWSDADLRRIAVPTAIVLGDRDAAISCRHTHYLARTIPGAKLLVLPGAGHFAMRQDPVTYNAAIAHVLDGGPAPKLGACTP